jgi:hypothetical protein
MELIETIQSKKLVFTVATGRCGTAFFAEILRLVPGTESVHEPHPEYAEVLRNIQGKPADAGKFLLEKKLPAIARGTSPIYVETSHLFCKGFLEPLLDLGLVPSLLWIRRKNRAIASSMYRGGTIPGRTEKGLKFYLSPGDPGVLPLPGWEQLDDYQLCYWYCLEIERRAREYRSRYRQNNWVWAETSLSEITTVEGMKRVVAALELPGLTPLGWVRYLKNRRRRVNPTLKSKQSTVLPENLDNLEHEVEDLIED